MIPPTRPVRQSQLITTWGVGSIVTFPNDESLMIAGLDMWDFGNAPEEFIIKEPRLASFLRVKGFRCPPDFRSNESGNNNQLRIPAVRFPRWHYCPICGTMTKIEPYTPLIPRCDKYQWPTGRNCSLQGRGRKLIPERFIVICSNGHIDDFPIMEWVHHDRPITDNCRLRRSTGSASGSLSGVRYTCSCGAHRSMAGATFPDALRNIYHCKGAKPWFCIEQDENANCENSTIQVVQRGASNVWFPDVRSSIYIPVDGVSTSENIVKVLDKHIDLIFSSRTDNELNWALIDYIADNNRINKDAFRKALEKRLQNKANDQSSVAEYSEDEYRFVEYEMLRKDSGSDNLGFYSKNIKSVKYKATIQKFFSSISVVPKIRETRALAGFSRLKPDSSDSFEKKRQTLWLKDGNWLPAIVVYGEGIFFEFDQDLLFIWAKNEIVKSRISRMEIALKSSIFKPDTGKGGLSPIYVLIHTFSHILINQLSFECGYGSSSIRERIYCSKDFDKKDMFGLLLYTASGDSEGSMGGLVRQGLPGSLEKVVKAAIENARWCSSDPICIQSLGQGPENCNLAACHNCALLPETCCENGNRLLDRALLIGTIDNSEIGFFNRE